MGEQTDSDDYFDNGLAGWHDGERVPGYEGQDPKQEPDTDDADPGVPIDTDYIDAPSERADVSRTDKIDPTIHRGVTSGNGEHWKNQGADTTDATNNPRGSTAATSWQRGDVDPEDRDRFDRLYMHQHSMGETTSDTRSRRREQERETILRQVCWNQTQVERARRLISNESTVGGWNFHFGGNVGMAIGYAFAAAYGNVEAATNAVETFYEDCDDETEERDLLHLSEKEASQAVAYAFSRLEEREIQV